MVRESGEQWRHGLPPILRVCFHVEALERGRLPVYAGSAWRGLIGHSLRRTVCVTRRTSCEGCLLTGTCPYSVFFESPPSTPEGARRYTALPHPFVLDVPTRPERELAPGEALRVGINLMGPAIDHLPYLIQAFESAGERGIGRAGGRFVLRRVLAEDRLGSGEWIPVYDPDSGEYRRSAPASAPAVARPCGDARLRLITPLRIKRRGRFVGAREFDPEVLLRNLISRLESLGAFYGDSTRTAWDEALASVQRVSLVAADLAWSDWTRFSSRQKTTMQMGGLVGDITLSGSGLRSLWSALWLGQWTHVGKGTSFGLGKYRLVASDDSDRPPARVQAGDVT
jgi:hypothetical protein